MSAQEVSPVVSPWLPFEQACEYLGLSRSTVQRLTRARAIPFYRPTGKLVKFKQTELDAWMARAYRAAHPAPTCQVKGVASRKAGGAS